LRFPFFYKTIVVIIIIFVESTDELREKSSSPVVDSLHPFDIRVERSGTGYNVSWTMDKSSVEHRVKRYVVKWYDARDGSELGSTSTAANKRYIGRWDSAHRYLFYTYQISYHYLTLIKQKYITPPLTKYIIKRCNVTILYCIIIKIKPVVIIIYYIINTIVDKKAIHRPVLIATIKYHVI